MRWFFLVGLLLVATLPSAHAEIDRARTSVVVYRCGDGFANLCSLVPETGAWRQLTFDGVPWWRGPEYDAPSLAPDGRLLAFAFDQKAYIAKPDATARLLIPGLEHVRAAISVRPGRKRIAVTSREWVCGPHPAGHACYRESKVAVVDTQRRILLQFPGNWHGVWAGRRLVVMYDYRDGLWIRSPPRYATARLLLRTSGKTADAFFGSGANTAFAEPAISPDGRFLALKVTDLHHGSPEYGGPPGACPSSVRVGRSCIWVLSLATKKLRRLTSGPADSQPAWSPDGRRIVFGRGGGCSTIVRTRSRCVLLTVDVATGSLRNLGVRGAQPTWGRRP